MGVCSPSVLRQVVCQEHIVELSYALQSGFSEGYLLPDRTLPNYKSMAQVLAHAQLSGTLSMVRDQPDTIVLYVCVMRSC